MKPLDELTRSEFINLPADQQFRYCRIWDCERCSRDKKCPWAGSSQRRPKIANPAAMELCKNLKQTATEVRVYDAHQQLLYSLYILWSSSDPSAMGFVIYQHMALTDCFEDHLYNRPDNKPLKTFADARHRLRYYGQDLLMTADAGERIVFDWLDFKGGDPDAKVYRG